MIEKRQLEKLYLEEKLSMANIAQNLKCSVHKVTYWVEEYQIDRRPISEAIYLKHNPNGDPFTIKVPDNIVDAELLGLGLGLYWGEGNKANKYSVRIGNTSPELLKSFILFLTEPFGVNKADLRFSLKVFSDINLKKALRYWCKELQIDESYFYKPTVTVSGKIGTYRHKNKYGVVTLYYHNKKLRDILVGMLPR